MFLPLSMEDCAARGWDAPDFVYVVGEAYADHPSFGHAIIGRVLEAEGFRVAMLPLPDFRSPEAFKAFGRPRLGFLVSSGGIDSMVNNHTVARRPRRKDVYAPGGEPGLRPDRAVTVYCNRIRQAYGGVPILIGGIEASLRRFSHYDYWDDRVRRSALTDAGATALMYGMGEKTAPALARWLRDGMRREELSCIRGICYMAGEAPDGAVPLPSHDEVAGDREAYARAFMTEYEEQDPIRGRTLCQEQAPGRFLVQTPPAMPLTREEMDRVYALPFERRAHPAYDARGGVPAMEEVQFSISAVRGCFGGCSFCALTFHQGRIVQSRSEASLLEEARLITRMPGFKGYIHDVGGPTANFREPACDRQLREGACRGRQCLHPAPCRRLKVDHSGLLKILRGMRALPGVKKVFIRSGLRYDYLMADRDPSFMHELCLHHVSGQLKVAPEHVSPAVLDLMGKPRFEVYEAFAKRFEQVNRSLGKEQYLVPYLISSHPGSRLEDAVRLAEYLRDTGRQPEQVQDFYPTPGTLSTCMYHTGLDPRSMEPVYVPLTDREKAMQRALLQWKKPQNHRLVREALRLCGREDLIGFGKKALAPPEGLRPPVGPHRTQGRDAPGRAGAARVRPTRGGRREQAPSPSKKGGRGRA